MFLIPKINTPLFYSSVERYLFFGQVEFLELCFSSDSAGKVPPTKLTITFLQRSLRKQRKTLFGI
jgi:hypothetical protein